MSTPTRSIVRLSALALGGLLVGLPARAARAAEPTTEAKAQDARKEAAYYRSLGGVGYKTGLEQREEAEAARYSAMAETLAAPEAATPAPSSETASPNCPPIKPAIVTPDCNR